MNKIISKKRILVITIFLITLLTFYYSLFRKKEKEDIYPYEFNINIGECEIDLEKLADLEDKDGIFWQNHADYIKCPDFDYKDTKELGDFLSACCSVRFNKKLHGKITDVSIEWEIPEKGKNNFIYYWIYNNQPFEGMYVEEKGDGTCGIILEGVTRNKTYEEIKQLAKEIVIHLNIQYMDGKKETMQITFGDKLINVGPYYNESYWDEYIVKKENIVEE